MRDLTDELHATGMRTVRYKGVEVDIPRVTASVTDNGWVGPDHPETATEQWGRDMLRASADYIVDFIGEFQKIDLEKACRIF